MLVACLDLGTHDQAQTGHEVGVITVRGAPRLPRVVGDDRPFLFAIERLDGGIDVENPRGIEQRHHTLTQVAVQPGNAFGFRYRRQRPAQGVLGNDLAHSQEPGIDPVAADGGDVRIAPVSRQRRQHPGAQHFSFARGVRAP